MHCELIAKWNKRLARVSSFAETFDRYEIVQEARLGLYVQHVNYRDNRFKNSQLVHIYTISKTEYYTNRTHCSQQSKHLKNVAKVLKTLKKISSHMQQTDAPFLPIFTSKTDDSADIFRPSGPIVLAKHF